MLSAAMDYMAQAKAILDRIDANGCHRTRPRNLRAGYRWKWTCPPVWYRTRAHLRRRNVSSSRELPGLSSDGRTLTDISQPWGRLERSVPGNVSSVPGPVGGDDDFAIHAYAFSKDAVISITRSIASYYAPRGVRANVICPSLIATPMSQRAEEDEHIRARLPQLQPLTGDFGSPKDVAYAALNFASDESSFMTGSVLTVDGGWR